MASAQPLVPTNSTATNQLTKAISADNLLELSDFDDDFNYEQENYGGGDDDDDDYDDQGVALDGTDFGVATSGTYKHGSAQNRRRTSFAIIRPIDFGSNNNYYATVDTRGNLGRRQNLQGQNDDGRPMSVSLNDIISSSFVHESANGEKIVISRGWPVGSRGLRPSRSGRVGNNHHHHRHHRDNLRRKSRTATGSVSKSHKLSVGKIDEEEKRRLLLEYLSRESRSARNLTSLPSPSRRVSRSPIPTSNRQQVILLAGERQLESALQVRHLVAPEVVTKPTVDLDTRHLDMRPYEQPVVVVGSSISVGKPSKSKSTPALRVANVNYDLPVRVDGAQPTVLPPAS